MNARLSWILGMALAALASEGDAQTVQLPTFSQFGVSTTVLVPDGGTMVLGGTAHARDELYELSPARPGPLDRRRSSRREVTSGTVRVWVHDFAELDARARGGEPAPATISTRDRRAAEILQRWRELHEQRAAVASRRSFRN